ncbi:MAG TPA: sulfur carrier protein ThiS [Hyphomicrobiaceae bacterium]|jgi:sulfur carrier protein|nr:sulfur carrier protein ThiS [Hyphomicrobiaceae bacterium]
MQLRTAQRRSVFVNGERTETGASSLGELVTQLGHEQDAVATAVNGEFVPRPSRAATPLSEDDRVEIVAPRQGG